MGGGYGGVRVYKGYRCVKVGGKMRACSPGSLNIKANE